MIGRTGLPVEGYIGFTYGSKTSEGTGTGFYIPKLDANDSFRLSGLNSVFQAEVYGMIMGCMKMLPDDVSGREVYILSDSESGIKALMSPVVTSGLVKRCKEAPNRAGLRNRINLVWVPGHSGIDGNERADQLARLGSDPEINGLRASIPIPQIACYAALKKWVRTEHEKSW